MVRPVRPVSGQPVGPESGGQPFSPSDQLLNNMKLVKKVVSNVSIRKGRVEFSANTIMPNQDTVTKIQKSMGH